MPEEKARIYISTELLSKLRLKNEDFWKFSLRSKRFRASSWRMLGWEQKREMNWTFISFALTQTFVRLVERKRLLRRLCLNYIHLQRSVIFTQRLCHGHADDLFPFFFFYLQKRLCHSLPRRRFLGEAFFLPPGNDGACTPNPLPLRNVTFSFCRCQKGRIIKHFNLKIFYVSVLIYHYEPAWNTTISRYKTLPLSFKDL